MEKDVRILKEDLTACRADAQRLASVSPQGAAGLFGGLYRSLFRGHGLEFEEVRAYLPGDDFRSLDWRVTARTGKPHTKVFREDRDRTVLFLVDLQSSMWFGTKNAFKAVAAARAAAVIAWLAAGNGDRIGGVAIGADGQCRTQPPARGAEGARRLFSMLEAAQPQKVERFDKSTAEAFNRGLRSVGSLLHSGNVVFVLSDFAFDLAPCENLLARLGRHSHMAALMVFDTIERTAPPPGLYGVSDGVLVRALSYGSSKVRNAHEAAFLTRQNNAQKTCLRHHIRFSALPSSVDTLTALLDGPFRREG